MEKFKKVTGTVVLEKMEDGYSIHDEACFICGSLGVNEEKAMDMINQVNEIVKAKADGRLLVIPEIKKGKTIYWIWGDVIMPCKFIRPFVFNGGGKIETTLEVKTKKDWSGGTKLHPHIYKAGDTRYLKVSEIGKTVFLNREDIKTK